MFKLSAVIVACLLLFYVADGKRPKKSRIKPEEEDNAPKPDVVSYSTFGVNDVGTYEGFVPSSPDFARFLTGANDESTTMQQPPSYPTSVDSNSYSNFVPGIFEAQPVSGSDNGNPQPSFMQYQQNFNGFFDSPFDSNIAQAKNNPDDIYGSHTEEVNTPIYGTKLGSRNKFKFDNNYNHTDFEVNSDKTEHKYNLNDAQPTFENKPAQNEFGNSFPSFPTHPSGTAEFDKTPSDNTQNPFQFQRVVDFTKLKYPMELDTSLMPVTQRPENYENPASAPGNIMFANVYSDSKHATPSAFKEIHQKKPNNENNAAKSVIHSSRNNYSSNTDDKPDYGWYDIKPSSDSKKKLKNKPWTSDSFNFKKWKEPSSPAEGYEYSTNYSKMSFKYGVNEPKSPFISSHDEVVPASSNIEYAKYQFPDVDYSKFKKIPSYKVHEDNEFDEFPSYKEKNPFNEKPSLSDFKKNKPLFTPDTGSYWGNSFKSTDFSSFKNHANKLQFGDITADEVVNIKPRRPTKYNYGKQFESTPSEWSHFSRRPPKTKRPWNDWSKEVTNKFKSEEDLLGLRNHDTSLPSYLPNYQSSSNYGSDEQDYKKLVDKWRQSYLKSKFKESMRDYETYASEAKPVHVPIPKPYPIEVAHPVIVPVPQPYPVRVPVAKPVAVPVYHEIMVPIEKPVPYPVYKKVPYPIEKLVPVPVEKEVVVPVAKPYPVHVPYIRPVFHHTKSRDEYDSERDDDDYFPRQESKKQVQYKKKKPNHSTRERDRPSERERPLERQRPSERPRRPSRMVYHDRNRRRWPENRRPSITEKARPAPYRHRDFDDRYQTDEERDYYHYCKITGSC